MRGELRRLQKLQIDSAGGVVYNHSCLSNLKRFAHAKRPPNGRFAFQGKAQQRKI
jgi:hypothetical protein